MKRTFKQLMVSAALLAGLAVVPLAPTASAINVFDQCATNSASAVCKAQSTDNATSMIKTVVNTMLFILGAIAVIMIVVGGIRYTTSNGDAAKTKGAKDTIMYAIVGVVVAISAFAIVNFVIGSFK